uniref:CBP80/20-dependent translation initiation factor n=1 Tax=Sphaeramia orbicularis TaxID=375764 RepID=A0A672YXD6_9TELE
MRKINLGTDTNVALGLHGGAGWDVQPEKLDFSHFHRKHFRGTPKHLPHIDREGMNKNKFEEDDGIDMNEIEKFLPRLRSVSHCFLKIFSHSNSFLTLILPVHQRDQTQSPIQQQHNSTELGDNRNNNSGRPPRQYQGGHGQRQGGPPHHGYSQNRRWHHSQKGQGHGQTNAAADRGVPPRTTKDKDSENVKLGDEQIRPQEPQDCSSKSPTESPKSDSAPSKNAFPDLSFNKESPNPAGCGRPGEGQPEQPKISLLQSSKERLRRRLKDKVLESCLLPNMDRLVELLNSMRSNSSGVEQQLASFMEEAQCSARSEETLAQVVSTIYSKAVSDRSFAATAAKLCDKMALFMVEGTKFRSLLLNLLQRDFCRREDLQQSDVEKWLGFITFLCEVFGTMRSSSGEPFRVLVCPIYTCLRELLESTDVKEDAVLCCSMELQSAGRLLEEQLPEMMTELLAAVRDKMLCPAESQLTRSLLMEVIELHAHRWSPLEALTTQYYNRTIQKLTTTA